MGSIRPLPPDALYRRCDPATLPFETTAELEEVPGIIGQERAEEAVRFAIGIRRYGYNLYALGPSGMGKTRTSQAIGHAACRQGHSVLYRNTAEVLEELAASHVDGTYRRCLRRYGKPGLLILDEFGYMGFDRGAARHLFRLVSERHEQASTVVVANTGFRRWKTFFPSEAESVATVDRLIDRALA